MSVSEALLFSSIMRTYLPNFLETRPDVSMSEEDTPLHAHTQTIGLLCFLKDNRKRHEGVGQQSYWHVT
jgi:hypothetical protein